MQSWTAGEIADADLASALGGSIDGVLSEYRLFDERGLVSIPDALSFEEAATLPCAAVTAWNALFGMKPIMAGQTVLTLGTGGVSVRSEERRGGRECVSKGRSRGWPLH